MYVEVETFDGWNLRTTTRQHTVSMPSSGQQVFELEAKRALELEVDVYRVSLIEEDLEDRWVAREIVFHDRKFAREG